MRRAIFLLTCIGLSIGVTPAAWSSDTQESPTPAATPNLHRLIDVVAANTKKHFLIAGVTSDVSWYGVADSSISYPIFLTILMDNNLGAIEEDGVVDVVPLANMRSFATPTITAGELAAGRIPDNQVVSMLVHPEHVDATKLVPILRPLMPQWSQLSAATDQNTFVMTDRFANVRRVANIIHLLDQAAPLKAP